MIIFPLIDLCLKVQTGLRDRKPILNLSFAAFNQNRLQRFHLMLEWGATAMPQRLPVSNPIAHNLNQESSREISS